MWSFFSNDPSKAFPYEVGSTIPGIEHKSLWKLHKGRHKSNGTEVTIFIFDLKSSSESQVEVARSSFKRIKTTRHPNVLTFLDGLETEKVIYMVTESVVPLEQYLRNKKIDEKMELEISWGIHQITKGLSFLINDCNLIHNNVCLSSIFVNEAGEWKLAGMDYMYPSSGPNSIAPTKILAALDIYEPPERSDGVRAGRMKKPTEKWSIDMWGFGCLIWEVFNGQLTSIGMLKSVGKIPRSLVAHYAELVGANPKSRPNPNAFLENCRSQNGYFSNSFIKTMVFLEEIQIKDQSEKNKFFNNLSASLDSYPQNFCKLRILPQLIHAYEFGNCGASVLSPLFKLGKLLDADEYQEKIVPCVIKLFSSTDRATRVKLLQQLELFIEYLSVDLVNSSIFPNVVQGLSDSNPVVREHSIKSMLHLAPKLNYKNLNEEMLKHFARLQTMDDQGGIRTNTTICLGKIAGYLHPSSRQKILSSAFLRSLKDPFPPSRQAGVLAMAATHQLFSLQEASHNLLPRLCIMTTDPEKSVRDQAFKTIKCFLAKLEQVSDDPSLMDQLEKEVKSGGGAETSGWTGWAVSGMSSITSKLIRNKANSSNLRNEDAPCKAETSLNEEKVVEESSTEEDLVEWDDASEVLDKTESKGDWDSTEGNGWDDDPWESMDPMTITDKPKETEEFVEDKSTSKTTSSYAWGDSSHNFFETVESSNLKNNFSVKEKEITETQKLKSDFNSPQGWDNDEWADETWSKEKVTEKNEAQRKREEKKQERQRELAERRTNRTGGGAMKLGIRKLNVD